MKAAKYELTVLRTRRDLMTLEDVASRFNIHPDLVRRFVDSGLLEPDEVIGDTVMLNPRNIKRVRTIERLRCDLGVNLAGIAVIFDLLDRLRAARGG